MAEAARERQIIASNRRARYEYEILDTWEAGMVLVGSEVKSLRAGNANLSDAYAMTRRGELWLLNLHISPYKQAGRDNPDPRRERKLLLHRREIEKLGSQINERGLTLVPLSLYFSNGRAKVEIGLARGKKRYDKRESIKRREQDREMARAKSSRRRR
jgi:SsrA-binding protein